MPIGAFGPCIAPNGLVAAMDPDAAQAGLDVLREGGNAIDAAIAIAAVMHVVHPPTSGLGGDAFMLVYDGKRRRVTGINGSGVAPYATSVERLQDLGLWQMPTRGIHAVTVPGAVDAYATALDLFGTMPLGRLLAPAIRCAEEGVLMGARQRQILIDQARDFGDDFPELLRLLCTDAWRSDRVGVLVNKDLAKTLRLVAEGGRDAFYAGPIAQAIVACAQRHDGFFTLREFADQRSAVYDPIATDYRGYAVYETAPPSQGHIVLEALNIAEGFDLQAMGYNSVPAIHHMAEAVKLAFADRLAYAGDPDFIDVPLETLLDKGFAAQRRARIDPHRASTRITPGNLLRPGDTTSFSVADKEGNAVSGIISLSGALGSGVVVPGTGIILNNRAAYFFFDPGHPNRLEPGKRTAHTLNAYMVCRGDGLFFLGNTPGGDLQPQLNFQSIANAIDYGMDPQQIAQAPNWSCSVNTEPYDLRTRYVLRLGRFVADATVDALEAMGHPINRTTAGGQYARIQCIMRDSEAGLWLGGSRQAVVGY